MHDWRLHETSIDYGEKIPGFSCLHSLVDHQHTSSSLPFTARARENVNLIQQTAVINIYWSYSLTSKSQSHLCKRSLKVCIFLPKLHCELNFIKFFWERVKKYLWDHCDCTLKTLKESMPQALASVELWEHWMHRWINALSVWAWDKICTTQGLSL